MDPDAVDEIIEDLQDRLSGQALTDALAEQAAALAPGEPGRAEFLNVRGEFFEMHDDLDAARACFDEALADGGPTVLHPLAGILAVELRRDPAAADEVLDRLLTLARDGVLGEDTCDFVGESLESHERYPEALRWFNLPLRDADPDDLEALPIGPTYGHFRARRALGLPHDRFDEAAERMKEMYRLREGLPGV